MKKVIAFAGSTSSTSINKQLATYASTLLDTTESTVVDMNAYKAALYSSDEEQKGFPENLVAFSEELKAYDGFIISLAEHNGSYAAAFKNTLDWLSRINRSIFNEKPVLLMAASPGGRGGASVLASAEAYFPHAGAGKVISFSFPKFYENFKEGAIVNQELKNALKKSVQEFQGSL
ncbi:MAG: NAD(P)H-dependent oxidoreductase [Flavobacteriaceae bacterium]|nr:NAD(P)H-dependent oxidoreductase [Flavobacteriaceae bacterium]